MATVLQLLAGVLILLGTIVVFLTAVALYRVRDAVTRVNALAPVTVLGVPLLVVGAYVHQIATAGFDWWGLVQLVITLVALLVVSSLASNALARATILSGAAVDPQTSPNDLGDEPSGTVD